MRILLTEDDDAVRSLLGRALAIDGHTIETASDGEQALDRLQETNGAYDLLVSDVKMPLMDGISLAHEAARYWPKLPILLITGFADQRERAADLQAVIRDVILKPFSLSDIRSAVMQAASPQNA